METQWATLEARAVRFLEHAREVEPRHEVRRYGSLLRLWHFPAFGAQTTWTILSPGRQAAPDTLPRVREVAWDRETDHQRVFKPNEQGQPATSPTIRLREALLPVSYLDQLLEAGTSLAVPILLVGNTVGLEGDFFGVETYAVSPNVRAQWWREGPIEWRHFTDWVGALRSFLLSALDRKA